MNQRVILHGQVSSWTGVNAGVPKESINDLADGLSSNTKVFIDDSSLFSVIHSVDTSAN